MNLAERAAAQYETSLAETQEVRDGYEQLRQLYAEKDEECGAALKAWSTDRSPEALERLQVARSNLATVADLLKTDQQAVAAAEASVEFYKERVVEAEVVEQSIALSAALARQQEYHRDDFNALQSIMLELIGKLDQTRKGWEAMHAKAHTLAAEAGVPLSRIQKLMEAEGYDPTPLRSVVATNNMLGLDASSQRQFQFPPAVDGSELAQQIRGVLIQFINRSEEERLRARAQQELAEADRRRAANRQRLEAEQDALDQQLKAKRQQKRPGGKVKDRAALEARTKATAATITYAPAEEGDEE